MLTLYGETFPSRLLLGTAAYPTPEILKQSVQTARPAMITVSLRRAGSGGEAHGQGFWSLLEEIGIPGAAEHSRLPKRTGSGYDGADGARSI